MALARLEYLANSVHWFESTTRKVEKTGFYVSSKCRLVVVVQLVIIVLRRYRGKPNFHEVTK